MAKFCTNCGNPTDENGVCPNCAAAPTATAAPTAAPTATATAAPAAENQYVAITKTAVKQTIPFAKSYWKTPMEATAEIVRGKNMALAAVLMVIYAIVNGLLIFTIYSTVISKVGSIYAIFSGSSDMGLSAPIIPMLIAGIGIAIVALVLTVGVVFAILKLCKNNADWKAVVIAVGCNTVALTLCLALSIVCIFLGIYSIAAVLVVLNIVLWMLLTILIPNQVFGVSYNGAAILVGAVAIAVAIYLTAMMVGKMNIYAVSSIETPLGSIGEVSEAAIEELTDFSVTDIMSDMVMDMF